MNSEESLLLKDALLHDANLSASYHELKSSMDLLDTERYSLTPSDFSLANIKSYARGFSSRPSKYINKIDLVLN